MRKKLEQIVELVKAQSASGQSVPEFCAAQGLEEKTFYVWRQRAKESTEKFARVVTDERVELELGNGKRVRVLPKDLKVVLEAFG